MSAAAAVRSLHNVWFLEGDPTEMTFEQFFDAVIGRYVLQFQHDPVAMLRRLVVHLRPGGVIAFHELDWEGVRSFPPSATYDRCCQWIAKTIRLSGAETRMGVKLASTFVAAGLPVPSMRLEAVVGGGEKSSDPLRLAADVAGTLLPEMERFGVATAGEVGAETLFERMINETIASASAILVRSEIGAWSRV
jgi:SAM-dependent methyltransferase